MEFDSGRVVVGLAAVVWVLFGAQYLMLGRWQAASLHFLVGAVSWFLAMQRADLLAANRELKERARLLESIVSLSPNELFVWNTDDRLVERLDASRPRPVRRPSPDLMGALDAAGDGEIASVGRREGERWLIERGRRISPSRVLGVLEDVTDLRAAVDRHAAEANRVQALLEALAAGLIVVSKDGTILNVNAAARQIADRWDCVGLHLNDIFGAASDGEDPNYVEMLEAGCVRLETADGRVFDAHTSSLASHEFLIVLHDATSRLERERELQLLANTDPLTGVANRRWFRDVAERALVEQQPFGIVLIDLDDFKPINDEHGHEAGDEVLRTVARRLARFVRPADLVARMGGDEFAVLLLDSEMDAAPLNLLKALETSIAQPIMLADGSVVAVSCSSGATFSSSGTTDVDELLAAADDSMYRNKRNKKSSELDSN